MCPVPTTNLGFLVATEVLLERFQREMVSDSKDGAIGRSDCAANFMLFSNTLSGITEKKGAETSSKGMRECNSQPSSALFIHEMLMH